MKEYDFYNYYEDEDKIKIYSDEIQKYFEFNFDIIIDSIDVDIVGSVIVYIEDIKQDLIEEIERKLISKIDHLNEVEIKKTKIILVFNTDKIEIC